MARISFSGTTTARSPTGSHTATGGFTKFAQFVPPLLTQLGFADDAYRALAIDNPARILARLLQ